MTHLLAYVIVAGVFGGPIALLLAVAAAGVLDTLDDAAADRPSGAVCLLLALILIVVLVGVFVSPAPLSPPAPPGAATEDRP